MKPYQKVPELDDFESYHPSAATMRDSRKADSASDEGLTRRQHIMSWVCCLVAAGIMIETLFFKFTAAPESVYVFKNMGTDPWWRWGQGIWELMAAICLLTPRLKWAGGVLTVAAISAAILSHLTWLGISIQGDHGLLFGMALVTFAGGFTAFVLHRHSFHYTTFLLVMREALKKHWPEYLVEASGLGLRLHVVAESSRFARSSTNPCRNRPSGADGGGHGSDRHRHHLLSLGKAIRSALESGGDADLLPVGQSRAVGRCVLHRGAIYRWNARRCARSYFFRTLAC
jgi:hypothetical protein